MNFFKTIAHYFKVGIHFIRLSICSSLEYPMNLLTWFIANPLNFFLTLAVIHFVVSEFGTLNGWNFEQLSFMFGLSTLSHGLSVVLFIQTWYMGGIMLHGEFDRFLLRPMNTLFQFLFMDFNLIGLADILPGVIIFIYGCYQIQFQWTLQNTIAIIAVLIGATLIRGALFLSTGSLAFWTKSNNQFSDLNGTLLDQTTNYPLSMYPKIIQVLFTFVMPLGFISFYPASNIIGADSMLSGANGLIWYTLIIGVVLFWLSTRMFNIGMRKYESAGS